ncbi:MAG: hypothetical protein DRN20_01025, partial [Thermoplasmata archaeon]
MSTTVKFGERYCSVPTMCKVLSLGGSLISEGGADYVLKVANVLAKVSKHIRLVVVVSGGGVAREYISIAKEVGMSSDYMDHIGIEVTRLNARIIRDVLAKLGADVYPGMPRCVSEACEEIKKHRIVVMGG